jgi:hypothetical protein
MPYSQSLKSAIESSPHVDITSLLCPRAKPLPPRQRIKVSRLRLLPTLYRTKGPNDVEPLAVICYKLSRPKLSLPQALSSRHCPTPH